MKSKIFAITLIVIGVITIVSLVGWFIWKPAPVLLQGEIGAVSYKISSQMPGRIDSLTVQRGQLVKKGDLIYIVRSKTIDAKLTQAEAMKTVASAQNTKVDNGARKQIIDQAYQIYQNALQVEALSEKTYNRIKNLYEGGVVPAQKFDEASAAYNVALNNARAAKSGYSMALEGAQWEDKTSAKALVSQASGAVAEVESYIEDGYQYAPVDGQIASIIAEQGELVGAGMPVVTLVDLSDPWASFNVKETLLPKLTVGKKFMATVPGLGGEYEFVVTYISPEASYATWSATRTTGEFDIKTFEVRAKPTKKNIENLRTGMSVLVNYETL